MSEVPAIPRSVGVDAVVEAFADDGPLARTIDQFEPRSSQRRMALYRNVTPLLMPNFSDRDAALKHAESLLVANGVLKPGETYAITCGEPMGYPGGTNMLKVCMVG